MHKSVSRGLFAALALGLVLMMPVQINAQPSTCLKGDMDRAFWQSIKNSRYAVPQGRSADDLAVVLLDCLPSSDPELRDGLAFETLSAWMRAGRLSNATLRNISATLIANLRAGIGEVGTDTVFRRTFSALVLSEVIRQDNRVNALEESQLRTVLDAVVTYLPSERDLRGFDTKLGWMHGVAHGADVLWRLASSPKLNAADLERLLTAVASKVAPTGEHFYTYGEGERLSRVVIAVFARGLVPNQRLREWLLGFGSAAPLVSWNDAFGSQAGLAKLHNTKGFMNALYVFLMLGGVSNAGELLPAVTTVLESLP